MNIVRELRMRKGIQQKELALELGISSAAVSNWEKGKSDPSGERLLKLAEFFSVEPYEIVGKPSFENSTKATFVPQDPEICGKSETEQIVEHVLEALGKQPKTKEALDISILVDNQPKEEREKAVAVVRALFSQTADQFEKRESNET